MFLMCQWTVLGATSTTGVDMMRQRDARKLSMAVILFAVLHISTHARALLLLLPTPSCSRTVALRHDHRVRHHAYQPPRAMLSLVITRTTATRAAPGCHCQTACSAAAKTIVSQQGGAVAFSASSIDRDLDGGSPSTRAEALTGFVAAIVSSAALLSEVSRARAEGDASPNGLGVLDDLLADCPSVRDKQRCCNTRL